MLALGCKIDTANASRWHKLSGFQCLRRALCSGSDDGTFKLWHAGTGQCLQVISDLPEHQSVTTKGDSTTVIAVSPRTWRYLRWQVPDEASAYAGATKLVRAEYFWALPERGGG